MQGILLESGSVDRYLALGKSGHPVSDAAQQILAVLQRHPQLQPFFAIPQRNQNGSILDWYSPVQGNVIPWGNASDDEKEQCRQELLVFTQAVENLGKQYVQNAAKNGSADAGLFGQLLQEACKIPSAAHIYLVEAAGLSTPEGLGRSAAAVASNVASAHGEDSQVARLQPVLTFWGFVSHEADRHRKPLYFLEPTAKLPPAPVAAASVIPLAAAEPAAPVVAPITPPIAPPIAPVMPVAPVLISEPWWKRWWLWLLLLPLLLLMLWLLRGCLPVAQLPGFPGVSLPDAQLPEDPSVPQPKVPLPAGESVTDMPVQPSDQGGTGTNGAELPPETPANSGGLADPAERPVGADPQMKAEPSVQANELPPATQTAPPELPVPPMPSNVPPEKKPAALEIPEKAADGVADFLNGKYHTRGGLMDKDTAQPLRLEYSFEKGKGQVEVRRSNGVVCKGDVQAFMKAGQLGIDSQGAAKCTDGSVYDMPKVQCKPDAKSAADCAGVYDNRQFPILMQPK